MSAILKHTTVLYLSSFEDSFLEDESHLRFVCGVPEEGESQPRFREALILRRLWVEFGQPDEITVTVEPGDTLNEGE